MTPNSAPLSYKIFLFILGFLFSISIFSQQSPQLFSTTNTFTVPPEDTQIALEFLDRGGRGGTRTANGEGRAYAKKIINVIPKNIYPVTKGTTPQNLTITTTNISKCIPFYSVQNTNTGAGFVSDMAIYNFTLTTELDNNTLAIENEIKKGVYAVSVKTDQGKATKNGTLLNSNNKYN